jgi:hypothetical protein
MIGRMTSFQITRTLARANHGNHRTRSPHNGDFVSSQHRDFCVLSQEKCENHSVSILSILYALMVGIIICAFVFLGFDSALLCVLALSPDRHERFFAAVSGIATHSAISASLIEISFNDHCPASNHSKVFANGSKRYIKR